MPGSPPHQLVLRCRALARNADFFAAHGFRIETVIPAESPEVIVMSGFGLELRLEQSDAEETRVEIRVPGEDRGPERRSPAGVKLAALRREAPDDDAIVPSVVPALHVSAPGDAEWVEGRAGMSYRDLIPSRLGGAFVASQIRIEGEGPVPDYVHHHGVRFQIIYCVQGWVRVLYQDQGESFVLNAGDCVLQPPHIRHRVLDSGGGLVVVEVSCPALHVTYADHDLPLPSPRRRPEQRYGGQRFVRHVARHAVWRSSAIDGFDERATGIGEATDDLGEVVVLRIRKGASVLGALPGGELAFVHVLQGSASVVLHGSPDTNEATSLELEPDMAITVPPGARMQFTAGSPELELLWVRVRGAQGADGGRGTATNSSHP